MYLAALKGIFCCVCSAPLIRSSAQGRGESGAVAQRVLYGE